jgi:hypothetical protein
MTIFHPEVQYPKPAIPYGTLPDELLHYWHRVFAQDVREPFPLPLLDTLYWQRCSKCGTKHARSVCPQCTLVAPAAKKEVIRKRGTVTTRRLFHTSGLIVFTAMQDGILAWLYHERDHLRREDGTKAPLAPGSLHRQMRGSCGLSHSTASLCRHACFRTPNRM